MKKRKGKKRENRKREITGKQNIFVRMFLNKTETETDQDSQALNGLERV